MALTGKCDCHIPIDVLCDYGLSTGERADRVESIYLFWPKAAAGAFPFNSFGCLSDTEPAQPARLPTTIIILPSDSTPPGFLFYHSNHQIIRTLFLHASNDDARLRTLVSIIALGRLVLESFLCRGPGPRPLSFGISIGTAHEMIVAPKHNELDLRASLQE